MNTYILLMQTWVQQKGQLGLTKGFSRFLRKPSYSDITSRKTQRINETEKCVLKTAGFIFDTQAYPGLKKKPRVFKMKKKKKKLRLLQTQLSTRSRLRKLF